MASLMLFNCSSCCLVDVVVFGWVLVFGGLPVEVEVVGWGPLLLAAGFVPGWPQLELFG